MDGLGLVSVILFGSAAVGGWSDAGSDVDLILVLRDSAIAVDRRRLREEVERLEVVHGFRVDAAEPPPALEMLMQRVTADGRACFICTRDELLSGSVERMLNLAPAQAIFVDRVVVANIVASAVTFWGEDLLAGIHVPPIRRFDVLKAFHGLFSQAAASAVLFPLLPGATRYAMGALKRSVHSCYFCYQLRRAPLEEEVRFMQGPLGASRTLMELLALRAEYRKSFAFVIRCLPTMVRLHLRTALDNRFPREVPKHH